MKSVLDLSNRKMVVITDPHIKYDYSYAVFSDGKEIETPIKSYDISLNEDNFVNIFMKRRNLALFSGNCWPGTSVWIDFFNEYA